MKLQTLSRSVAFLALAIVLGCEASEATSKKAPAKKDLKRADIDDMMKSLSNWGRWGENDQLGTLNLITPKVRKDAARLVNQGLTISMARNVIKEASDQSPPFEHKMLTSGKTEGAISAGDEYSVQYHGFTQTHMDALCHLFHDGKMYNGYAQTEVTEKGAARLGVDAMKNGVFTRGVLMDIPRLLGKRYLEGDRAIYPEDLEAWEKKAGFRVGKGDAVLIHTGRWIRRDAEGGWEIMQNSAGLHASCVPWLKEREAAVVGSDLALDVMPSGIEGYILPVHWLVVVALGMPILDNCDFGPVSDKANELGRWTFLLTAAPLAVGGGTGSPINPLATF